MEKVQNGNSRGVATTLQRVKVQHEREQYIKRVQHEKSAT